MKRGISRRRFISSVAAASAFAGGSQAVAQRAAGIRAFDHIALPMEHTEEMLAFYRGLGFDYVTVVVAIEQCLHQNTRRSNAV